VPVAKLALAAVLLVATVTFGRDEIAAFLGLGASLGLGIAGLRDLMVPVRLEADLTGLTVTRGFGRRRHHPWEEIERVRIDDRRRLLGRSTLLEVDVDTTLYFFGRTELGVSPVEVLDEIAALRYSS
jgi:hypothetical protein